MARSLKFRIYEEEKLYYPCSENKGADQLRGYYREADLRFLFSHMQKSGFLTTRLKCKSGLLLSLKEKSLRNKKYERKHGIIKC